MMIKMKKTFVCLTLLLIFVCACSFVSVFADTIITEENFNFDLNTGESFAVEDSSHSATVTFSILYGSLTGTGNLMLTDETGILIVTPNSSGTIQVTSNIATFYVLYNGLYLTAPYVFEKGTQFLITWQYTPPSVNPIIIGSSNTTLYFRSDTYTTNNVTAYGLDQTNTATPASVTDTYSGDVTVEYGFRVWLVHYSNLTTELTSGSPVAVLTRAVDGVGYQNASWTPEETRLSLGYDAVKVVVYLRFAGGAWSARASYISHSLVNSLMYKQTWTFYLYTSKATTTSTTALFMFGSPLYNSRIGGVGFRPPTAWEIQTWRLNRGDYLGFILGAYVDKIGPAAYLLLLLIPCGSLYLRHRNLGPVIVLFILFGGPGGIIWAFVPLWAAAVVDILLLIGAAFLVFKVIR